jgi:hypothetical protein
MSKIMGVLVFTEQSPLSQWSFSWIYRLQAIMVLLLDIQVADYNGPSPGYTGYRP